MPEIEPLDIKPMVEPMPAVSYARPWLTWEKVEWFDLQWSHRAGTVALVALIASLIGAMTDRGPYGSGLAAAAVIADVGLIGGILAWWTDRRHAQRSWEPLGVIIFNLLILILAAGAYAAGHWGYLVPAAHWLVNLFPQTPPS